MAINPVNSFNSAQINASNSTSMVQQNTSISGTPKEIAEFLKEMNTPASKVTLGESDKNTNTTYQPGKKGLDNEQVLALKAEMAESSKMVLGMFQHSIDNTLGQAQSFAITSLDAIDFSKGKIMFQGKELVIDEETRKKAAEAISDDGFYGIDNTAQRALDFAKALSGDDPKKAKLLKDAVVKAYDEVSERFGGKMPEISVKTQEKTLKLFDDWANSLNKDQETAKPNTPGSTEKEISDRF